MRVKIGDGSLELLLILNMNEMAQDYLAITKQHLPELFSYNHNMTNLSLRIWHALIRHVIRKNRYLIQKISKHIIALLYSYKNDTLTLLHLHIL